MCVCLCMCISLERKIINKNIIKNLIDPQSIKNQQPNIKNIAVYPRNLILNIFNN